MLFGAELSKVYATNAGEHAKQHLPTTFERIVEPFEKAGELIEQATKDEYETEEKPNNAKEPKKKEKQ